MTQQPLDLFDVSDAQIINAIGKSSRHAARIGDLVALFDVPATVLIVSLDRLVGAGQLYTDQWGYYHLNPSAPLMRKSGDQNAQK